MIYDANKIIDKVRRLKKEPENVKMNNYQDKQCIVYYGHDGWVVGRLRINNKYTGKPTEEKKILRIEYRVKSEACDLYIHPVWKAIEVDDTLVIFHSFGEGCSILKEWRH